MNNLEGIAFKNSDGEIVETPRRKRKTNIDDLPYPDWDSWSINEYIDHSQVSGISLGRGYQYWEVEAVLMNTLLFKFRYVDKKVYNERS